MAIIHYDDIALKGGNRKVFEQQLIRNVARKIAEADLPLTIENRWGRIVVAFKDGVGWDERALQSILSGTPGVSVFGIGVATERDDESIYNAVTSVVQNAKETFATFRISTTRVDKSFPCTSQEMDTKVGTHVLSLFDDGKRVQLQKPDVEIRIEILNKEVYVYIKQKGLSGLPVGSSGKAVALLSGGFDSPVAVHMCMTRGVKPILMHFHAYPQTSKSAIEKVEDLAQVLRGTYGPLTLVLVPLLEAQKEIALVAPEKLRVVLYRRLMMKVAQRWAEKERAQAIITGESIGQVASQTLENMGVVEEATTLPVLRPLAGMHKKDIIERARVIGTHDISVLPHDDTCTVFMPKNPETKAKLAQVHKAEELYDSERLIDEMVRGIEVLTI